METGQAKEVAILNPGAGLGDHIMCLPMVAVLKRLLPGVSVALASSANSRAINDLTDAFDVWIPIPLGGRFKKLLGLVNAFKRLERSDAVLYIGKSMFVPLLYFFLTGKKMVAYGNFPLARLFLKTCILRDHSGYLPEQHARLATAYCAETAHADQADVSPIPSFKGFRLSSSAIDELGDSLKQDARLKIMIHPGVSKLSQAKGYMKAWPAAKWADLIRVLPKEYPGCRLYLLGGPEDKEIVADILRRLQDDPMAGQLVDCTDKTSGLEQLSYLLSQADIVVTVDSFPMHLAVAMGIPTVAIFASTDETVFAPASGPFRVASRQDLPCRPCLWRYRKKACKHPVCLEVPVENVLDSFRGLSRHIREASKR